MDIETFVKEAYSTACEKGWHDTEPSFEDVIANIHAELGECWEEYRNNHELNEVYYSKCKLAICLHPGRPCPDDCMLNNCKPEGIPIELADVLIRIFDTFGAMNIDVSATTPRYIGRNINSLAGLVNNCHIELDKALVARYPECWLLGVIGEIQAFCAIDDIDLDRAIELKMAYNKTRPYRHNGKRV